MIQVTVFNVEAYHSCEIQQHFGQHALVKRTPRADKVTGDKFDTHGSVHHRLLSRNTSKMQCYNRTYYSKVF
jgi:hypothetical protein